MISVIMGSKSDLGVMSACNTTLWAFEVSFESLVVSAHRTPLKMVEYARSAKARGIKVIIAGAGGAAHLPGMVASLTTIPVIGVPIKSSDLDGTDSILSILQMPSGVPVATVALNGAKNAAILALRILSVHDERIEKKLEKYYSDMEESVFKDREIMKRNF